MSKPAALRLGELTVTLLACLMPLSAAAAAPAAPAPLPWHAQWAQRADPRMALHSVAMAAFPEPIRYLTFRVGPHPAPKPARRMLVLLHGLGGDPLSWLDLGRIVERLDKAGKAAGLRGCLVVMPAGGDGYWADWVDGHHPYGTLVLRVVADAARRYKMHPAAADVALVGVSMGGFGALSIGLLHPERFGFVAGLSATDLDIAVRKGPIRPVYRQVLGDPPRPAALKRVNPYQLVVAGRGRAEQRFLVSYGSREAAKFRQGGERLVAAMGARKLRVVGQEVKGGRHGWSSSWAQAHPLWIKELGQFWRPTAKAVGAPTPLQR